MGWVIANRMRRPSTSSRRKTHRRGRVSLVESMSKTFNPFDADEVQAAWPLLAELRRETPVADLDDGMRYVTRLDECRAVLRETTAFPNARGFKAPGVVVPPED